MSGGYGKLPNNGGLKKGRSGNSKGRPKKQPEPVSRAYLFRKVANEMVAIEMGSSKEIMTRWEALVRQVQNLALSKDPGAARLLHRMRNKFPGKAAPAGKLIFVVSDNDMKL